MCEILVDDFSLLNSALPDAEIVPLSADSGRSLGHAEAVHRIVESWLANDAIVVTDGHIGRVMTLPILVRAPQHGARSDMSAKIDLALRRPKRATLIPCDNYGAKSWWRIQWTDFEPVYDDVAEVLYGERAFKILLGVEAFARSAELYTATASNSLDPVTIFDGSIAGDRADWVAENGTLVTGSTYVGVDSDGSTSTRDTLKKATLAWDPTAGYSLIRVEAKVVPGATLGGDGGPYPSVYVLGYRGGMWYGVAAAVVKREALTSGWYAETLRIVEGDNTVTWDGLGVVATGGDWSGQDLQVRNIQLLASNTTNQNTMETWIDLPGSAPAPWDIEVPIPSGSGMLLWTGPSVDELADHNPLLHTGPSGTYHLILDIQTYGTATHVIINQGTAGERTIAVQDIPIWPSSGFVCIADDLDGPTYTLTWRENGGVPGTAPNINKVLTVFADDPLIGLSAEYTIVNHSGGTFRYKAPTPERPVPRYTIDGDTIDYSKMQAIGRHVLDAGVNHFFVAWTGTGFYPPSDTDITAEGYAAWGDLAVPRTRWRQR